MVSDSAHVGIWMQADTVTFNKTQKQIINKLKKVICFPGILSEFKVFVGKLMGIGPSHPAIPPVYELIVGKTVNYFPCKKTQPKAKRKSMKRLSKTEKGLKSILEEMGICLKIPLSINDSKISVDQPDKTQMICAGVSLDKDWCDKERKRILEAVKKRVGLHDKEVTTELITKRKKVRIDRKKRKHTKKRFTRKPGRLATKIEVIDIAGMEEDDGLKIIEPNVIAASRFEVIDITEQDDDLDIFEVQVKTPNNS